MKQYFNYLKYKHMNKDILNNKHKVACIGSGPSSMAFAKLLLEHKYDVTIYEKEEYIGGVLKWGIPSYRINPNILSQRIDYLKNLGCKFINNCNIGIDISLKDLIDKYDAIFIGVGVYKQRKLNAINEDLKGIYNLKDFLSDTNIYKKHINEYGEDVVIVGGGNSAIDAARNATRLPNTKNVTIIYRRSLNEMPANAHEISKAKEEGIKFMPLTNPIRFIGKDKIESIECSINVLGEKDESGRRKPIESSLPHIYLKADSVILSIGFETCFNLNNVLLNVDKKGCFVIDEHNETNIKNVYAGGDCVSGASSIANAIKAGENAAKHYLTKKGENI